MKDRHITWLVVGLTAATVVTAATGATVARTFGDGTHRGGSDIKPGTYRAPKVSGGLLGACYWARLRNFSGGLNGIIANGNETAPALVTTGGEAVAGAISHRGLTELAGRREGHDESCERELEAGGRNQYRSLTSDLDSHVDADSGGSSGIY